MPKRYSTKKSKKSLLLIVSLLFFLALPLVAYTLLERTLDTRSKAFDRIELSDQNPCIISLPNVNPYSLEVGKSIRIQVDAKLTSSGIRKLNIMDPSGKEIYKEDFPNAPLQIGTSFIYTPEKSGTIDILGSIDLTGDSSAACKISSPYDIRGIRAIVNNSSPEFTSQPKSSKPGQDIKTGIQYEYTLTAEDEDKDRINYFYSFTPRADWLKAVIVEDGSSGRLTVVFRGTTDKAASYLAHVVIHDGYSMHVRTQSWVISVSPSENDIPIVKIIDPLQPIRIDAGKNFDASWTVSDLNHIERFQLFMAKNPSDESTWKKIGADLAYNVVKTTVPTEGLSSGTYKLVVKATDNQDQPKSGVGISPEIVISRLSDRDPVTDDEIILPEPQITNMSPTSSEEISNRRVTIKGTIIASEGAKINETSIVFKVNDENVTEDVKINKITDREYTLIYQPTKDLKDGVHKAEITFSDTNNKESSKSWEFTINESADDYSEVYTIFGKEISKRTLLIIGMGLFIIILAICIPLLISLIWGKGKSKDVVSTYTNRNIPYSTEYENQTYIPPNVDINIKDKVDTTPVVSKEKEIETYAAPTIDVIKEDVEVKPEIKIEREVKVEEPVIKVEEPIIKQEEEKEDIKFEPEASKPEVKVKEETTVRTEQPVIEEVKTEEGVAFGTTETQNHDQTVIEEPEAPDPSIFQSIADQIKEQTSSDSETN
ncbi:MAG: hypothetical protein ACOX0R_00515 [Candidatus Dojkabacteria bacterium]|jgi:hypothetical protein